MSSSPSLEPVRPYQTLTRRALVRGGVAALTLAGSVRSARAETSTDERIAALSQPLAELERFAHSQKAELGAVLLDMASHGELCAVSPHLALNPASNQKILTLVAALEVLGPQHRFNTTLHGRSAGEVVSELVLRSDGNPDFSSSDLAELVRRFAARGYRRVEGDIYVDQAAFDANWEPPAYEQRPNDWAAYRAPVSAVALDRNSVTLRVLPTASGSAARVWFEPPGLVEVTGSVLSGSASRAQNVRLTLRPEGERLRALVGGTVPENANELGFSRRLAAPAVAAGYSLLALLQDRGISVAGSVRLGGSEVQAPLARVDSVPLGQLAGALGKRSDNFCAEMLLKAVGAKTSKAPGSSPAGARVIEEQLTSLGAFDPNTRISNGSGLYDANRVSAFALARTLSAAAQNPRIAPEFIASLAIGGVDGTLSQRFVQQRDQRNVRGKTGTLADVLALCGYVLPDASTPGTAFALLLNRVSKNHAEARRRLDAVVQAVASARLRP